MKLYIYLLALLSMMNCHRKQPEKPFTKQVKEKEISIESGIRWLNNKVGVENAYELKDTALREDDAIFVYGTNATLPKFVRKNDEYKELNGRILLDFENDIRTFEHNGAKSNKNEYRLINYKTIIKDSVLTVVIKDLRANFHGEPVAKYEIYHLDFKNNKLLDTQQMLNALGLSQIPILNAFAEQCAFPPDFTQPMYDTKWFDNVRWKNINLLKFYHNEKHQLVIIYRLAEYGLEDEQILE